MFEQIPLHLLLAMTCVAEVGFHKSTEECQLMWEINERNAEARNRSLKKQTLLFNSYWKSKEQRSRRPWIRYLEGEEEPKHWPKTIRWGVHKRMWIRYVRAARVFLANKHRRKEICPGALDYGAPQEYPRQASTMKRVWCVDNTLQWYWALREPHERINAGKGILSKKALSDETIISESILTRKRRQSRGTSN